MAPEGYACTRGAFLCWKDACNLYNVKMPVGVVAEIITPGLLKLFSEKLMTGKLWFNRISQKTGFYTHSRNKSL